ncbi:MAG: amidohydrolase family protein, partial [Myxococcota bacterium]
MNLALPRSLPILGAILAASATAVTAGAAPALAQTTAIRNATVHIEPGVVVEGATVVMRGGTIRAVGKNAAIPAGARVIDGTDKVVTAGLVESHTMLGLVEVSLERTTREAGFPGGKGSDVIRAAYRASDGYNAASVAIPVARQQGVTAVVATPRGGLISGASAWFALADKPADQVLVQSPLAIYAALGEAAQGSAEGSRGMAVLRLREALDDARVYSRNRRTFERGQSRPFAAGRLDLEALLPVVQGRLPLVVHAHRESDISAALRLADEFRLRLIIAGATEAWMLAKTLADRGVGVILDPSANLPGRFERIYVRDDAAKILADAGVSVAISSLGPQHAASTLRQLAGLAVANGMKHEQALASITRVPAEIFGVDRGTLKPGAAADLVVWSGDPFELATRA